MSIVRYRGKRLEDMSKEELIKALRHLGNRMQELQEMPKDFRKMAQQKITGECMITKLVTGFKY